MNVERLLEIRTGRQPHELAILGVTVAIGIAGLLIPESLSPAVDYVLHGWVTRFFYGGLAFFATLTLVGCLLRQVQGLLLERVGLVMVAHYYAVYGGCAFAWLGFPEGALGALLPFAYAGASVARVWQIRTDLALLKSYLKDHPGARVR